MTDDALATHLATMFVFDESGRIVRNADPDRGAGPRLYIGGCETGNVVRLRHDVGAETARAMEAWSPTSHRFAHPTAFPRTWTTTSSSSPRRHQSNSAATV